MGRSLSIAERLWAGFSFSRKRCLANEAVLLDHFLADKVSELRRERWSISTTSAPGPC